MAINFPNAPSLNDIYTLGTKSWKWNAEGWEALTTGASGYSGYSGAAGGITGYSGLIGDNSATQFNIAHNLAKGNIFVVVRQVAADAGYSGYFYVYPDIQYYDTNTIIVNFVTAPTTNQYLVSVLGF
jgi:hypothetical protein